jgi:hypothetical protein
MAGRIVDGGFWIIYTVAWVYFGCSDGGDIGTGSRPCWVKDIEIGTNTAGWTVDITGVVCDFVRLFQEEN